MDMAVFTAVVVAKAEKWAVYLEIVFLLLHSTVLKRETSVNKKIRINHRQSALLDSFEGFFRAKGFDDTGVMPLEVPFIAYSCAFFGERRSFRMTYPSVKLSGQHRCMAHITYF
jgi:hypothetical protein